MKKYIAIVILFSLFAFSLSASDVYFYPGINLNAELSCIKDEDIPEESDYFYTSDGINANIAAEMNIAINSLFLGAYYRLGAFYCSRVNKKRDISKSYSGWFQECSLGIGIIGTYEGDGENTAFMLYPLIFRNGLVYDEEKYDTYINWWKSGIQCSYSIFIAGININWVTNVAGDSSFDLFPDCYIGIRYSPFF